MNGTGSQAESDAAQMICFAARHNDPTQKLGWGERPGYGIGGGAALANLLFFYVALACGMAVTPAIVTAFAGAAVVNYFLCILILFRHKARWGTAGEIAAYVLTLAVMGLADFGVTGGLIACGWPAMAGKAVSSLCGFVGNFFFRRNFVFQLRKKK